MKKRYSILVIMSLIFIHINIYAQDNIDTPATGLIPSNINLKYNYNQQMTRSLLQTSSLPSKYDSKYDLRELNRVTSVKDQRPDGTCWVFASTASAESSLLRSGMIDTNDLTSTRPTVNPLTYNFSENHMKQSLSPSVGEWGFSIPFNTGGQNFMATAYLARAQGEVLEKNDPYVTGNEMRDDTINKSILADKYLEKAIFIPEPNVSSYYLRDTSFRDKLKQAVVDYGGIFTGFLYDGNYYNYTTHAYNYSGTGTISNHAVCIVGWDDNYSASNFKSNPNNVTGAFIAKNSWGADWGENGYFYISYDDKYFGKQATAFVMSPVKQSYKSVYQYDPLGWVDWAGFGNNTAWFANVFAKKSSSEYLTTVGFYATDVNTSYKIYYSGIDANKDISSASFTELTSGVVQYPGYYAIDIPNPPSIDKDKFVVAVNATTTTNPPVPIECVYVDIDNPNVHYTDNASASAGQSYVRSNEFNGWYDVSNDAQPANVCVKAFTSDSVEYRTVFKQNSLTTGQVDFRVYCNNKLATPQSSKVVVAFLSGGKLIGSKILDYTFPASKNSYNDFSFTEELGTTYSNVNTKVFVTSPFESTFAPLMRYAEEMNKN